MAISDKLTYLNETKNLLKTQINYGLPTEEQIDSTTTFREYVSSIFNAFLEALRTPDTLFTNLPKKSGSGSVISLNDTANAPMRIELGATELTQASTPTPSSPQDIHTISGSNKVVVNGKNLFDKSKALLGYEIRLTSLSANANWFVSDYIPINNGDVLVKNSSGNSYLLYDKNKNVLDYYNFTNNKTTINNAKARYIRINSQITNLDIYQLEFSNTATTYEPYISQEADIDLSSTNIAQSNWARDFVNAVANLSQAKLVDYNGRSCLFFTPAAGYGSYPTKNLTLGIKFKENTQYTISYDILKNTGGTTLDLVYSDGTHQTLPMPSATETWEHKTFTTTANKTILYITPYYTSGNTYIDLNTWQINEGTQELPYMPYYDYGFCGSIGNYENIPIRTSGKNLFDKDTATYKNGYIKNDSGVESSSSISGYLTSYVPVKPNTQYTILGKFRAVGEGMRFYYYDSSKTWISRTSQYEGDSPYTITTPNNCYYLQFQYITNSYDASTVQIAEGNNTSYEPYGNGTWYIKKNIGKAVLDGSADESWGYFEGYKGFVFLATNQDFSNRNLDAYIGYCNYFSVNTNSATWTAKNYCGWNNANAFWFIDDGVFATNAVDLKTYLQTHNLIVYYILATPTYTKITGTLASQLENVYQKMLSYEGQTNISQVNNDLSFNLSVQAIEEL